MAAADRTEDRPLDVATLLARAPQCSFFEVVRLLQASHPEAAPVGHGGPVEHECLRFACDPSLGFPASDIAGLRSVEPTKGGGARFELLVTFLGLLGSSSPLPFSYAAAGLDDETDESLVRGFLDLFHHRLVSLFYRAWEKYRYPIGFLPSAEDRFSRWLLALAGLGPEIPAESSGVFPVNFLAYSGLLSQMPRSASALRGMLADYFEGIPVEIEECVARTIPIDHRARNRLARENSRLGEDVLLGERVLDIATTFRIRLGPVGLDDFLAFLPPGPNLAKLLELVGRFNSESLEYEVEVGILEEEIPPPRLSSDRVRLGWSSWLGPHGVTERSVRFTPRGPAHGQR